MSPNMHPPGDYAELAVTSNFTFLTGASHPEEMVTRAAQLGLKAIAITDHNSLAGVVRAYAALKNAARGGRRKRSKSAPTSRSPIPAANPLGNARLRPRRWQNCPRLIVGARLVLRDSPVDWVALPRDRAAYQRLTRLLTLGKRRAEKGECHLDLHEVTEGAAGMILIALPRRRITRPTGGARISPSCASATPAMCFWARPRAMTARIRLTWTPARGWRKKPPPRWWQSAMY